MRCQRRLGSEAFGVLFKGMSGDKLKQELIEFGVSPYKPNRPALSRLHTRFSPTQGFSAEGGALGIDQLGLTADKRFDKHNKSKMKKAIQKLALRCGYRISRSTHAEDAFAAMQSLLMGIKEPIIFDVGAHHGHISRAFRELFPTSTLYAFEPFEESFEQLKANTASDPKIHPFNFGLSDREGTQSFHSNPSSATNSLLSTDELGPQTWRSGLLETQKIVQAHFKTIDSVVETLRIPRIDILKLDVQGAEHLIIKGASTTCGRGIVHLIYSEIITQPTYKNQKRFDEALASFYNNGFDLYGIYNMSLTTEGRLRQVDTIFTRQLDDKHGAAPDADSALHPRR